LTDLDIYPVLMEPKESCRGGRKERGGEKHGSTAF
jgi:hypothetical protein